MRVTHYALVCSTLAVAGCQGGYQQDWGPTGAPTATALDVQPICSLPVASGAETVARDMETDYLPNVLACELGEGRSPAAYRALAIAARSFAYYIAQVQNKTLKDSTQHQVYGCAYASPTPAIYEAVNATRGIILSHGNQLVAGMHAQGSRTSTSTCRPSEKETGSTEWRITYNQGRSGAKCHEPAAVAATCLTPAPRPAGHPDSPNNRGVMSQFGAECLGLQGKDHATILAFYFGTDAVLTPVSGSCANPVPPVQPKPPLDIRFIGDECTDDTQCRVSALNGAWQGRCQKPNGSAIGFCTEDCSAPGGQTEALCPDLHLDATGTPRLGYLPTAEHRWAKSYCGAVDRAVVTPAEQCNNAKNTCKLKCTQWHMPGTFEAKQCEQSCDSIDCPLRQCGECPMALCLDGWCASGLGGQSPQPSPAAEPTTGLCYSRCDYQLHPGSGCRAGFSCRGVKRPAPATSEPTNACVPL